MHLTVSIPHLADARTRGYLSLAAGDFVVAYGRHPVDERDVAPALVLADVLRDRFSFSLPLSLTVSGRNVDNFRAC